MAAKFYKGGATLVTPFSSVDSQAFPKEGLLLKERI